VERGDPSQQITVKAKGTANASTPSPRSPIAPGQTVVTRTGVGASAGDSCAGGGIRCKSGSGRTRRQYSCCSCSGCLGSCHRC
jgi:hypothetical protein